MSNSSSQLTIRSTFTLVQTEYKIHRLGFGVFQSPPPKCVKSCLAAFKVGYRLIDTAQSYGNEASVGRAIRESKIPRSEFFITSKILNPSTDLETTHQKILDSVKRLAGADGYVDLFLIHSPNGGSGARKLMWQALEEAQEDGKIRSIGVSNYGIGHIEEIKNFGKAWPPAVNQIELHPWCQQREVVEYCRNNSIIVEAYCPLVRNQKAHDKALIRIAKKHNVSTNQVLIRYGLQKKWVPLPKSDTPTRIADNADVFDFELDEEDMKTLDDLDQGAQGAVVQAVKNNLEV